jgi:hypothetical protein
MLEGNLLGQRDGAAGRHGDVLGVPAVTMLADHLPLDAELLAAQGAVSAVTARDQIVESDSVADLQAGNVIADFLHDAGYLVPGSDGQRADG